MIPGLSSKNWGISLIVNLAASNGDLRTWIINVSSGKSSAPKTSFPVTFCTPSSLLILDPTTVLEQLLFFILLYRPPVTAVTLSNIFLYPVQRQSTPPKTSSISLGLGFSLYLCNHSALMSIPGIQIPH